MVDDINPRSFVNFLNLNFPDNDSDDPELAEPGLKLRKLMHRAGSGKAEVAAAWGELAKMAKNTKHEKEIAIVAAKFESCITLCANLFKAWDSQTLPCLIQKKEKEALLL